MKPLLIAALALAACGGSTTIGTNGTCSVTLSGVASVAGTYNCAPTVTGWQQSNNMGAFGFAIAASGTAPGINVGLGFPGEPHSGTYSNTDTGAQGGVAVTLGSGASTQAWAALSGTSGNQGSYSLKFTGLGTSISTSAGKTYGASGSLDATLPGSGSTTGTVTLHVTFQ